MTDEDRAILRDLEQVMLRHEIHAAKIYYMRDGQPFYHSICRGNPRAEEDMKQLDQAVLHDV